MGLCFCIRENNFYDFSVFFRSNFLGNNWRIIVDEDK